MTIPDPALLETCKRVGRAWANAPDEEFQQHLVAAVTEGAQGAPPEPPEEEPEPEVEDPQEPTEEADNWTQGDVTVWFEADTQIYESVLGDPLILSGAIVRPSGPAQINPTPKDRYTTALALGKPLDHQDRLRVRERAMGPGEALVCAVRHDPGVARPRLKEAQALSCANTAPPKGFFRPPYTGGQVRWTVGDIQWDRLPTVELAGETPSKVVIGGGSPGDSLIPLEDLFSNGPWLDHMPNWPGRELHPTKNMPMDGKDIGQAVSLAMLACLTAKSIGSPAGELMRSLTYGLIQYGIDLMGIVKAGGHNNWVSGGQHGLGRLWPILFAGLMLDDEEMLNVRFRKPHVHFSEIGQTFFVTQEDVNLGYGGYTSEHIGMAEWGNQHDRPAGPPGYLIGRQQDDVRWTFDAGERKRESGKWQHVRYRLDTIEYVMGAVLASQLLGLERYVDHAPLYAYCDRMWDKEKGAKRIAPFVKAMWEKHRA